MTDWAAIALLPGLRIVGCVVALHMSGLAGPPTLFDFSRNEERPGELSRSFKIRVGESERVGVGNVIAIDAWQGECSFEIALSTPGAPLNDAELAVSFNDDKPTVVLSTGRLTHRMFEASGGFEWELTLDSVPLDNAFRYGINSRNLVFAYQGALTPEEIADGAFRPDSVVGSYAVYHARGRHSSRRIHGADTTYKLYGTGKAFHIYRPRVWDAAGDIVWGLLDISNDTLTLTIDYDWLHKAEYPVVVDPYFGMSTLGATTYSPTSYALGFKSWVGEGQLTAQDGDQIDSLYLYLNNANTARMALYTSQGADYSPTTRAATPTDPISANGVWTATAYPLTLTADTVYTICVVRATANNASYRYDNHPQGENICSRSNTATLDDPWVQSSHRSYMISMYAKYTQVGESASSTRRRRIRNK